MILYLDTSALVKLYVRERGSMQVRRTVARAGVVATSIVAYAEARAAFARLARERRTSRSHHHGRVRQLDRDWDRYAVVELSAAVARNAGELAEQQRLRGFDAIHLASALWLKSAQGDDLLFHAFDSRLNAGAVSAGLALAQNARRAPSAPRNLATAIGARFRRLGGVELALPAREPVREPPRAAKTPRRISRR